MTSLKLIVLKSSFWLAFAFFSRPTMLMLLHGTPAYSSTANIIWWLGLIQKLYYWKYSEGREQTNLHLTALLIHLCRASSHCWAFQRDNAKSLSQKSHSSLNQWRPSRDLNEQPCGYQVKPSPVTVPALSMTASSFQGWNVIIFLAFSMRCL